MKDYFVCVFLSVDLYWEFTLPNTRDPKKPPHFFLVNIQFKAVFKNTEYSKLKYISATIKLKLVRSCKLVKSSDIFFLALPMQLNR